MDARPHYPLLTRVPVNPAGPRALHQHGWLLMGSCFSESIGHCLARDHFRVTANPFGIVYNPFTLALQLERLLDDRAPAPEELEWHMGLWHSFWYHGRFGHPDKNRALDAMESSFREGRDALYTARYLVLTWGHNQVFTDVQSNIPVANCHKWPSSRFREDFLTVGDMRPAYERLMVRLKDVRPDLRVIVTVSPVRYLRRGFLAHTRGKAQLHLLAEWMETMGAVYFPSYEIQMDELRDYRFYADDLIHPSPLAVEIIYERFLDTWLDPAGKSLLFEIRQLQRDLDHRPLHPETREAEEFRQLCHRRIRDLRERHPDLPHLFIRQAPVQ